MVNYFELYSLQPSFQPDIAKVKEKYYELSRQYHPDRFAQADNATRAEVLRMAALNNDAYKVLGNSDATMAYVLKLHQLLEDEEKYTLPPDFLMEMMELNEAITEYEMEGDEEMKQRAIEALDTLFTAWTDEVAPLVAEFEKGNHSEQLLRQIKDYYFRRKYLLRIKERIATFATR